MNNPVLNSPLYYLALNVYQYSYIKPLYRELGGEFIIHKPRAYFQLKRSFWGFESDRPTRDWIGLQPKIQSTKYFDYRKLSGIMVTTTNSALKYNPEKLSTVFIGHGTGDKPYKDGDIKPFDYYWISGEKHMHKIRESDTPNLSEDQMVKIGNLRFDDVVNGRIDKDAVMDTIGIQDRSRPNIVYAPTWKAWGGGTLLDHSYRFIREFTKDYNLIIRPHYYDWRNVPPVQKFIEEGGYEHVYIVDPKVISGMDTMENLSIADLLISDTSSIMYEFLIMQKPIIIIDVEQELTPMPKSLDLRQVVDHWDGESNDILPLVRENIETNKYSDELHELLHNCFYFNDGKSTERAIKFLKSV